MRQTEREKGKFDRRASGGGKKKANGRVEARRR